MSTNRFHKAERRRAHIKIAITGPSGSGKTYSALQLARGVGGKIAMIDTESGSGELYSALCDYDVMTLAAPFTVAKYNAAIKAAVDAGYDVLIIDSLTHAWAGEGGLLAQKESLDSRGGNSYTNWATITKQHEQFKATLLQTPVHIIATMRSKQDYILQANDRGKQVPVKVGLAPIQRDGMEYEFTTVFDVAMNHEAAVSKDRTGLFDGIAGMLMPDHGKQIAAWLAGATAEPVAQPAQQPAPKVTLPGDSFPGWQDVWALGQFKEYAVSGYNYDEKNKAHLYKLTRNGVTAVAFYTPSTDKSKAAAESNTGTAKLTAKVQAVDIGGKRWPRLTNVKYLDDTADCPPVEPAPTADEAEAVFKGDGNA